MKSIKFLICAAISLLALPSCAQKKGESMKNESNAERKVLVAYFSATGTTRNAACKLAEAMNGDLHEIKPETPYTSADLDWHDKQSRSTIEMHDPSSRPAIVGKIGNMAEYDVVFIGFPIWWYTVPTIINTFIESYDLQGKILIPFATSGGSTIEKSCKDLKTAYPKLNWKEGRLLNSPTESNLEEWKKILNL